MAPVHTRAACRCTFSKLKLSSLLQQLSKITAAWEHIQSENVLHIGNKFAICWVLRYNLLQYSKPIFLYALLQIYPMCLVHFLSSDKKWTNYYLVLRQDNTQMFRFCSEICFILIPLNIISKFDLCFFKEIFMKTVLFGLNSTNHCLPQLAINFKSWLNIISASLWTSYSCNNAVSSANKLISLNSLQYH